MSWTSRQMLEKGKIPIEDTTTGYTAAVHSYQNQDHTPSDARFGRLNGWCCGDAPAALRVQHTLQQPKPAIVQSARATETCSSCGFEKIAIRWTVLYVLLRFFHPYLSPVMVAPGVHSHDQIKQKRNLVVGRQWGKGHLLPPRGLRAQWQSGNFFRLVITTSGNCRDRITHYTILFFFGNT